MRCTRAAIATYIVSVQTRGAFYSFRARVVDLMYGVPSGCATLPAFLLVFMSSCLRATRNICNHGFIIRRTDCLNLHESYSHCNIQILLHARATLYIPPGYGAAAVAIK